MASNDPIGGNIQHTAPAEHNTSAVPHTTVVDAYGVAVVDACGAVVIDVDGTTVVDVDAMPITVIDYR